MSDKKTPRKRGRKSSNIQVQERVKQTLRFIAQGHMNPRTCYAAILEWLREKHPDWGEPSENAFNRLDWKRANEIIKAQFESDSEDIIAQHYEALLNIYRDATSKSDLTNARGALADIRKIKGIEPATKSKVEVVGNGHIDRSEWIKQRSE